MAICKASELTSVREMSEGARQQQKKQTRERILDAAGRLMADGRGLDSLGLREVAREAGLEIGERGGIVVDTHMRTSDPHIWAAGDAVETAHTVLRPGEPARCDRLRS